MKGRESGMPPQEVWESFFSPAQMLGMMELDETVGDVVEFGCGYGTFTIPAARRVKGTVHAIDIDAEMVEATRNEAKKLGLHNVNVILRDFLVEGTGFPDANADYALLFNILHIEHPETMLNEAWRVLKIIGRLGMTHWNYDSSTPRGPALSIRPTPEQCIAWASSAGFGHPRQYDLKPYHWGIVMEKGARR